MALYAGMTQANQDAVDELLASVRPLLAQLYKVSQKHAVALSQWFTVPPGESNTLANAVAALDAGALIPNKTNLAGADSVTKESLQTAMSYVSTVAGFCDSAHLNAMLPFAGSANFVTQGG